MYKAIDLKKILSILFALSIALSCSDNDNDRIDINEQNFLIFGHYYGMCVGEGCVETFKLTDQALYEDTIDDYAGEHMEFVQLNDAVFEQVKDLADFFPNKLLSQSDTVFGCPDCADGGGLLIQYSQNGKVKTWRIDQSKMNVPEYLHTFMDKVNEKIALINNHSPQE